MFDEFEDLLPRNRGNIDRTDARLDWHTPSDNRDVGLVLNNLFNKRHVIREGNDTTDVFGIPYAKNTPRRVLGLAFRINSEHP